MKIAEIDVLELEKWFKEGKPFSLLDIRGPEEQAIVEFPQTTHRITMGNLTHGLSSLPEDLPLVIYCRSGIRSLYATRFFQDEGFENAYNLKGGILEYIQVFKKNWPVY